MAQDHEFRKWILEGNKIDDHHGMGDVAGVRFGLYFPGDVRRVVDRIQSLANEEAPSPKIRVSSRITPWRTYSKNTRLPLGLFICSVLLRAGEMLGLGR